MKPSNSYFIYYCVHILYILCSSTDWSYKKWFEFSVKRPIIFMFIQRVWEISCHCEENIIMQDKYIRKFSLNFFMMWKILLWVLRKKKGKSPSVANEDDLRLFMKKRDARPLSNDNTFDNFYWYLNLIYLFFFRWVFFFFFSSACWWIS